VYRWRQTCRNLIIGNINDGVIYLVNFGVIQYTHRCSEKVLMDTLNRRRDFAIGRDHCVEWGRVYHSRNEIGILVTNLGGRDAMPH